MKTIATTVALFAWLSVASAESSSTSNSTEIPFYLKTDSNNPNQVIAVVYYGEMGDTTKEIDVPCTMKNMKSHGQDTNMNDMYSGPGSIMCTCEPIGRSCNYGNDHYNKNGKVINNAKCQLQVPYVYERDVNGTITSVTFNNNGDNVNGTDDTVLIVPFYPQTDSDGNVIAVTVSSYEQEQNSNAAGAFVSLLLWFVIVVAAIFVAVFMCRFVKRYMMKNSSNKSNVAAAAAATTNTPTNVKNVSDLEDPVPRRVNPRQNSEDQMTTTSSSDDDSHSGR